MAKEIDVRFPAREGHAVQWRLSKAQINTLSRKYGEDTLRTKLIPKIRARVRSWYGKSKSELISRNWSVALDSHHYYDLRTGKFSKRN